ncbi:MAG: hypothetical protein IJ515_01700 [Clostridia bacterium]|nr:hypothetical protein [Clostridia bacterium]
MSNTSMFKKRISDSKFLVIAVAILALVVDASLMAIALLGELDAVHWVLPMIVAILDLIIIPVALASNFRFRYAQLSVFVFKLVALVFIALIVLRNFSKSFTVFTITALIVFAVVQVMSLISLLVATFRAAKPKKSMGGIAVLCTVLLLVLAAAYPLYIWQNGIYGQGDISNRNVAYSFDDATQSYTVCDVLDGKGESVVIPADFNGKPVKAIDCSIFNNETVNHVYLECDATVEFINPSLNRDVNIYIRKEMIDVLRTNLAEAAREDEAYIELCNRVKPSGLEDNEIYITFAYTEESLESADYKLIKTWFGKKGDTFSLDEHAEGIVYAEGYNLASEDFLYRSYNNNKKVLLPLTANGTQLNGTEIKDTVEQVAVEFERVYAIQIAEDNDTKYESADSFRQYQNSGYRYVLGSDSGNLLAGIAKRDGFSLEWEYSVGSSASQPLTKLSDVLGDVSEVTVYPVWSLNAPEITLIGTNRQSNSFIYAEDITLKGVALAPVAGFDLTYSWSFGGEIISTDKETEMEKVLPSQDGVYTFKVIASSSSETSLVSESTARIDVEVAKRPVTFGWTLPASTVYSGLDKAITINPDVTDFVPGDNVTGSLNISSVRDAGSYTLMISIDGAMADLYCVDEPDRYRTLVITPCPIEAVWVNTSLVYNRTMQAPTATAYGVGADASTSIELAIEGRQQNAGTAYTATATSLNPNYVISNSEQQFEITPKELVFTWPELTEFVYNGKAQAPTVTMDGIIDGDTVSPDYSDYAGNVGVESYVVTVIGTSNPNYKLPANVSCDYSIIQREITLTWQESTALTYNGRAQSVIATVGNAAAGETVGLIYADTSSNIGVGVYTANVTGVNSANYKLPANITCEYEIVAREITLTWSGSSLVYNGEAQQVTATPGNVVSGDTVTLSYSDTTYNVNVGQYQVTVISTNNPNYKLPAYVTTPYLITPKTVTLTWSGVREFVYDGSAKTLTATVGGVIGDDVVSISYTNSNSNGYVGTHTVTAVSLGNDNYQLPANPFCNYTITKRLLTLTWDTTTSFVYDGAIHSVTAEVGNTVFGDSVILTYSSTSTNTNKGNYTSEVVGINNPNYQLPSNVKCAYEITARELTVVWDTTTEFTYDGTAKTVPATFDNVVPGETVTPIYSNTASNKNVGSYSVAVTGASSSNYKLPTANTSCSYRIVARELTVSWPANTAYTYNGNVQMPSVTLGNIVGSDSVVPLYSSTNSISVGDYSITVTGVGNGNYKLPTGNLTCYYSIEKYEITLNWQSVKSFVYDGTAKTVTATAYGALGERLTLNYSDTSENINANNYTVTVTGVTDSNYKLPASVTCSYVITPREITLTWGDVREFVYDGTAKTVLATVGNTVSGDVVNIYYSDTSDNTDVNSYEVTVIGKDNGNYKLPANVTCTYKILPKTVTLNWSSEREFVYDGTVKALTATVSGTVDGEIVTVTAYENSAKGSASVGSYTMTATTLSDTNYKLPTNASASYKIVERELTVIWGSNTEFTYDGQLHKVTATLGNTVYGDSVAPVYSAGSESKNAGTYTATLTGTTNSNYKLPATNLSCEYTIVARKITLVWDSTVDFVYDGKAHAPTATVSGAVSGESVELTYTYTTGAGVSVSNPTDVGTYKVSASTDNGNYVITNASPVSFEITAPVEEEIQ